MTIKNKIRNRVLRENTAQGVLNRLREFESNRARMQTRWIWELLQNARDAAGYDASLVASVECDESELVFQHNGRGFTKEEVAHLIFHGSTKLEDEGTLGQYGSGFLTTHLLSPEIDVSGKLNKGQPFSFRLKREIGSSRALAKSMEKAWDEFFEFGASEQVLPDSFTTRFRYPVGADSADVVKDGIETLKCCAPFVVVFNRQFQKIHIKTPEKTTSFEVMKRIPLKEGLQTVTVGISEFGSLKERKFLLAEDERVSVTVPVESTENESVCLPLGDMPRLFLGFPLIGTEKFSFPAVINSFEFTPTENRDGVFLGQSDNSVNQINQSVVTKACDLLIKLIEFVTNVRWKNSYTLADIPSVTEQDWLSKDWLYARLKDLVFQIRQTPAVLNGHGSISPKDSIFPLAGEDVSVRVLWDLFSEVRALRNKLPVRNEVAGWYESVESWAGILNCCATSFDEGYDARKLVSFLEEESKENDADFGTLQGLQNALCEDVDAVEWLNRLFRFLKDNGLYNVILECTLVLDQAGYLDKLSNLYHDNVDNELKVIGEDILDLDIREQLRDTCLTSLDAEIGKGEKDNNDVVREITMKLKEHCDEGALADDFTQASSRLLAWIANNQQWTHLSDFPAFSKRHYNGSCESLRLRQKVGGDLVVHFAPIRAWAKDLQQYADLFPRQYIMADDFFAAIPDVDVWKILSEKDYVRTDVLVNSEKTLVDFLPDEPLPDGEHKSDDVIAVTEVIHLTRDKVGIMTRVRNSRARARLFWRFLTEWLVSHDSEGLEHRTVNCVCGESHAYFQSAWLVPVIRNHWVPQGNNTRDRATAQSLATLLRDSGWTPNSLSDSSTTVKLMNAIRVTRFDLTRHFVVSDKESGSALDDTMTNILVSTGGDLQHVQAFVNDMKTDADLPNHLAKRRERRRIVKENQQLGVQVEQLVKGVLEDQGFTVTPTGIGSDFEIQYDLIEESEVMSIELSRGGRVWLVEVKSARAERVRMTAKQAKTAVKKRDGFLLCVVPVGRDGSKLEIDDIRTNMRFVQKIGSRVERLCQVLEDLDNLQDNVTNASDGDIRLEILGGTARIRIDSAVWQNGLCLCDLAAQLE